MKHYRKIVAQEIESISCDYCNKRADVHDFAGATDVNFTFGYPSEFDLSSYKFDICDDCFKQHFSVRDRIKPKEY